MAAKDKKGNQTASATKPAAPRAPKDLAPKQASAKKGTRALNASLDAKNPIPLEYNSKYLWLTSNGKGYIPFLNGTDTFFQLLLEAKLLSPTNLACVSTKSEYCLGGGWNFNDKNRDEVPDFLQWAKSVNRKQQSLNDIIRGGFESYWTSGNGFIEVVRGRIGGTPFLRLYKRNFMDCRLSDPDEDDVPTSVLISKQFRKKGYLSLTNRDDYFEVPIWSPNMFDNPWVKDSRGFEHTIFHLKYEMEGYDYYGMPSNVATLPQQILEYKAARYNIDNFDNNLVIGGAIVLKGDISDEEAEQIANNIIIQHTGDGKRGRFVVISSEGNNVEDAKIIPYEKQSEASYLKLDQSTQEKIISGNQWDAVLGGIHQSGSSNTVNSAYIRSIFDIKKTTLISPAQGYMAEKFLRPLMYIADETLNKKWSDNMIGLTTVMPVSFLGDIDVNAILTINEGRKIAGLDVITGEQADKFIKTNYKTDQKSADPKTGGEDV